LGNDDNGSKARRILEDAGLDLKFLQLDQSLPTGRVNVTLSAQGNASYVIVPGVAYDSIEVTPALKEAASKCAVLCFGTLVQRSEISRKSIYELLETAPQAIRLLDVNLRKDCFSPQTVEESLRRASMLKLNHEEVVAVGQMLNLPHTSAAAFSKAVAEKFGTEICIVTSAENGAYARAADGTEAHSPGYSVKVADTVGSGDSFTAAFVFGLLNGLSLVECCELGNQYGAAAATKVGGMAELSAEEVARLCPPRGKPSASSTSSLAASA
jgi:fructokinase